MLNFKKKKKKKKIINNIVYRGQKSNTQYIYIYIWRLSNFTCPLTVLRVYHMA